MLCLLKKVAVARGPGDGQTSQMERPRPSRKLDAPSCSPGPGPPPVSEAGLGSAADEIFGAAVAAAALAATESPGATAAPPRQRQGRSASCANSAAQPPAKRMRTKGSITAATDRPRRRPAHAVPCSGKTTPPAGDADATRNHRRRPGPAQRPETLRRQLQSLRTMRARSEGQRRRELTVRIANMLHPVRRRVCGKTTTASAKTVINNVRSLETMLCRAQKQGETDRAKELETKIAAARLAACARKAAPPAQPPTGHGGAEACPETDRPRRRPAPAKQGERSGLVWPDELQDQSHPKRRWRRSGPKGVEPRRAVAKACRDQTSAPGP